jgi:hypothetical protein
VALVSWCPQCDSPVSLSPDGDGNDFACETHGPVMPLWRPAIPDYGSFAEALVLAGPLPTYLPWPMSPGWTVADFGCVVDADGVGLGTVTTTAGTSELDGDVQVTIVTEEPGIGLGARCAGTGTVDPGPSIGAGPPAVHVRVEAHPVPMWLVPSSDEDDVLARSVFAGESGGRWLWLVMRPASAALLLRDDWLLANAGEFGPEAVEIPFGGAPPSW